MIALVILVDRRYKLGHGRAFALYVAGYTLGRAWIENLRIDTVNEFAGLRLNVWMSMVHVRARRRLLHHQPPPEARPGGHLRAAPRPAATSPPTPPADADEPADPEAEAPSAERRSR